MTLTRESCHTVNETLGVYLAPGGEESAQVEKLTKKLESLLNK